MIPDNHHNNNNHNYSLLGQLAKCFICYHIKSSTYSLTNSYKVAKECVGGKPEGQQSSETHR